MTVTASLRRLARFDALVLTALIWFLAKFVRLAFPPLFDAFQETYSVSNTALGAAFTGLMLVYAAMQFPSGLLADHLGSVKVITAGALAAAVAALTLVVDSPFVVLAGAMLLIGAGTGAHKTVAVRLLSRTYPRRVGRALGVLDTFGASAGVAAPAAVVVATGSPALLGAPWRTVFLVAGTVGVGLAGAFAMIVPSRLKTGADTTSTSETDGNRPFRAYLSLFREWQFSVFVLATVLVSFGFSGVVAFLPLYLIREAELTTATAGLLYSVLFAVSIVQLATGEASDRVGNLSVIAVLLSVATGALVALVLLVDTVEPLVLGVAVAGFGLGGHGYRPVRGAYLMSTIPDSISGGGLGVVRTLLLAAGAASPVAVGYLSETVGFRPAFWLLAVAMAAAVVLVGFLYVVDRSPAARFA